MRREQEAERSELSARAEELRRALQELEAQRRLRAQVVPREDLALYDRLASRMGGVAVARVVSGTCQACRVSLPSGYVQRARTSSDPVYCSSCGRILYVP